MPYFGQDMFLKAEAKGPLTDKEYLDALNNNLRLARQEGIDATMDKYKLDALVAPTGGPAWLTDLIDGDNVRRPKLHSRGSRLLPQRQRPRRLRLRPPGRHLLLRPRLERANPHQTSLRLRASHQSPQTSAIPTHSKSANINSIPAPSTIRRRTAVAFVATHFSAPSPADTKRSRHATQRPARNTMECGGAPPRSLRRGKPRRPFRLRLRASCCLIETPCTRLPFR